MDYYETTLGKLRPNQEFKLAGMKYEYIGKRQSRCVVYGPMPDNNSLRWMVSTTVVMAKGKPEEKPVAAKEVKPKARKRLSDKALQEVFAILKGE